MFTMKTPTELVHRVFLTVLLVGILGNCAESPHSELGAELASQIKHGEDQDQNQNQDIRAKAEISQNDNNSSGKDVDSDKSSKDEDTTSLSRSIPFYYGGTNTRNYPHNSDSNYDSYYASSSAPASSYYYNSQRDRDRDRDRNYERHGDSYANNRPSASSGSIASGLPAVISSTSYSIKPGSGGSGSNVYINTKPVPIIISSTGPTVGLGGSRRDENYYYNQPNRPGQGSAYDFPRRGSSSTSDEFNRNNYGSATNFNLDCVNSHGNRRNCPSSKGDSYYNEDENRSYYAVLNGNQQQGYGSGTGIRRYDDDESERYHAVFPFNVRGLVPEKDKIYTDRLEDGFPKRRVTRTSTTSSPPGWVKLQPIASRKTYDPFFSKEKEVNKKTIQDASSQKLKIYNPNADSENDTSDNEKEGDSSNSKIFANRLGVELSPESFAERWGWTSGGSGKGSGSRLPSWLEELNSQHHQQKGHGHGRRPAYGTAHSGPTRDEDPQNWVKLEAIPVAGVSISKWVPKGTSPQELPSTGNLIRDRPSAWWDARPDNSNSIHKRPSFLHQYLNKGSTNNMGWGTSSTTTTTSRYPILHSHQKKPGSGGGAWNDIIYPDTPVSATASWESSGINSLKGISGYPSSFPSMGSLGWKSDHSGGDSESSNNDKDHIRRPVASWSAPGSSGNHRFGLRRPLQSNHFLHSSSNNGNGNPSTYPDPQAPEDDPRWVLVSNSRRASGAHPHGVSGSDRHKYRPPIDRYRDDLDWDLDMSDSENDRNVDSMYGSGSHNYHRLAKDFKLPASSTGTSTLESTTDSSSTSTETIFPPNPLPDIYAQVTQDEAFRRVNATLQSLMPVLNLKHQNQNAKSNSSRRTRSTPRPETTTPPPTTRGTTTRPTTTRGSLINRIPQSIRNTFLSSFIGNGRQAASDPVLNGNGTKIVISRKPNSLKPILAAVGAGMIPATMAAVLPMVMGRRKKRDVNSMSAQMEGARVSRQLPVQLMTPVVFQNHLYLVPSGQDEDGNNISRNSRIIRNNYGYEIAQNSDGIPSSNSNTQTHPKFHQHRTRASINAESVITR